MEYRGCNFENALRALSEKANMVTYSEHEHVYVYAVPNMYIYYFDVYIPVTLYEGICLSWLYGVFNCRGLTVSRPEHEVVLANLCGLCTVGHGFWYRRTVAASDGHTDCLSAIPIRPCLYVRVQRHITQHDDTYACHVIDLYVCCEYGLTGYHYKPQLQLLFGLP